jgi:hypothetical protein
MPKTNGQPQPWDAAKVRKAWDDARRLAGALGVDATGDAYRRELDAVMSDVFPEDEELTQQQVADRVAYMLYGAVLFGFAALTVAEATGDLSRSEALAHMESSLSNLLT